MDKKTGSVKLSIFLVLLAVKKPCLMNRMMINQNNHLYDERRGFQHDQGDQHLLVSDRTTSL
jgi:hypothetical protein